MANTKPVRHLAVGDIVTGIGGVEFTHPVTVITVTAHDAKAKGKAANYRYGPSPDTLVAWWPFNMLGDQQAVVA